MIVSMGVHKEDIITPNQKENAFMKNHFHKKLSLRSYQEGYTGKIAEK